MKARLCEERSDEAIQTPYPDVAQSFLPVTIALWIASLCSQ
jgi:hypothetical protein